MSTACKALFLDRDGVINRERGAHTWTVEDFEVLPTVEEALVEARMAGYRLVVITNQSGIGLGLYGNAEVERLHGLLAERLARSDVHVDDILYCPHHPSKGRCLCRKPGGLLLEKAIARHGISPSRSWFIGDRERDMEAAGSVGVRGMLIASNDDLLPVVRKILNNP